MAALRGNSPGQVGVGEKVGGGEAWRDQPGATAVSAHLTVSVAVHVTVLTAAGQHSDRPAACHAGVLLYGESDVEHRVALATLAAARKVLKPDGGFGQAVRRLPR